jgi:tetratricopeptide (TPR) repeat protein
MVANAMSTLRIGLFAVMLTFVPQAAVLAQNRLAPAVAPSPSQPVNSNTALLRKGTQLIDAGRLNDAIALFSDYCRSRPQDASGFFWLGVCYDEMNNYQGAIQAYNDAIIRAQQSGMDSSEIRTNLANTLLKTNDIEQAIGVYKKALEINPLYALAYLNLGRAYLAKKDFDSALKMFDKCDELHFTARQLPYYRAKALLALDRKSEAAATLQRLLLDLPDGEAKKSIQTEFATCLSERK